MSQGKIALFFSISDRRLYEKLESLHQELFPGRACAFLGSTFADADWRPGQKSDFLPTSRLLWRWVFMNERTERLYIPAIRSGKYDIVFVHEFGREAYQYAIRHFDCPQTLQFQKSLVELRLISQGGMAPSAYLSARPSDPRFIAADNAYFDDPKQHIKYLNGRTIDEQFYDMVAYLSARLGVTLTRECAVAL